MFGYIKPYVPELKVKEHDAFKSVYCGLCKQLGRSSNPLVRLTLNYDSVFLAVLLYATQENMPTLKKEGCSVNPLSKVTMCVSDEILRSAAQVSVTMLHYKVEDNVMDSKGISRLGWKFLRIFTKRNKNRYLKDNSIELDQIFLKLLKEQSVVEEEKSGSIDRAAHPTGEMLSALMDLLVESSYESRAELRQFVYLVGRYIYLCDAFADMKEDLKSGNYNPFLIKYEELLSEDGSLVPLMELARESLLMTIGEIIKQLDSISLSYFQPIIYNICDYGLKNSVEEIFIKEGGTINEHSL